MKLSGLITLATLAIAPVFASTNQQAVSDISTLASKAKDAKTAIEGFNGGLVQAYSVATAIYNAHQAARTARNSLASADSFTEDEWNAYEPAYTSFGSELSDALDAGLNKASAVKGHGLPFAYIAEGMILSLQNEKGSWQQEMQKKVTTEQWESMQPRMREIDQKYKNAAAAFQD